jgi:hypothetical protein
MPLSDVSNEGTLGILEAYPSGRVHIVEVEFNGSADATSSLQPIIDATGLGGGSSRAAVIFYNDGGNAQLEEDGGGTDGLSPTLDVSNQNLAYRNTVDGTVGATPSAYSNLRATVWIQV